MRCCVNRPNTWMHLTEVTTAEKLLRRGGRPPHHVKVFVSIMDVMLRNDSTGIVSVY